MWISRFLGGRQSRPRGRRILFYDPQNKRARLVLFSSCTYTWLNWPLCVGMKIKTEFQDPLWSLLFVLIHHVNPHFPKQSLTCGLPSVFVQSQSDIDMISLIRLIPDKEGINSNKKKGKPTFLFRSYSMDLYTHCVCVCGESLTVVGFNQDTLFWTRVFETAHNTSPDLKRTLEGNRIPPWEQQHRSTGISIKN